MESTGEMDFSLSGRIIHGPLDEKSSFPDNLFLFYRLEYNITTSIKNHNILDISDLKKIHLTLDDFKIPLKGPCRIIDFRILGEYPSESILDENPIRKNSVNGKKIKTRIEDIKYPEMKYLPISMKETEDEINFSSGNIGPESFASEDSGLGPGPNQMVYDSKKTGTWIFFILFGLVILVIFFAIYQKTRSCGCSRWGKCSRPDEKCEKNRCFKISDGIEFCS